MLHKTFILFTTCLLMIHCTSKETKNTNKEVQKSSKTAINQVYSYSNKQEFEAFKALQLDSTHANLLNPQVAKDAYQEVSKAWVKLHADIGNFLSEKEFNWNSSDSAIKVFHKIYFEGNGQIKHHFINVVTPSVSNAKVEEFSTLLRQFGANYQVAIKRTTPFAQCGKTKYAN